MSARVPLDVDLEDKLIYGLSPLRFAYLVMAVLACLCTWRFEVLPVVARLPACLALACAGATLAWGRLRGQAADRLLIDVVLFVRHNYHLKLSHVAPRRRSRSRRVSLVAINALAITRTRNR